MLYWEYFTGEGIETAITLKWDKKHRRPCAIDLHCSFHCFVFKHPSTCVHLSPSCRDMQRAQAMPPACWTFAPSTAPGLWGGGWEPPWWPRASVKQPHPFSSTECSSWCWLEIWAGKLYGRPVVQKFNWEVSGHDFFTQRANKSWANSTFVCAFEFHRFKYMHTCPVALLFYTVTFHPWISNGQTVTYIVLTCLSVH